MQSRSLIGTFKEALIYTITINSALNIVVWLINYRMSAQCVLIKMDLLSIALLLFYCRYSAAKRAIMLQKRRRLVEAQRRILAVQRLLRRRQILITFVAAVRGSYHHIERRFWISSLRYSIVNIACD